ncbi:unnamed protein product [Candidula unifasciata]|uniref:Elongin-C n=1 Tax=Candidula unifasciata TaxID=100452 RepID=A0A8S3YC27_9EUPU|nr:unnamed protein product [Candidula unifasciata]
MSDNIDEDKKRDEKVYGGIEDGHEFIVKRDHALTSGTIKAMLSGPVPYTNSSTEIPEFPIAPEIALELLMAANFDC